VVVVTWACSRYGFGQKVAANLLFGADHAPLGDPLSLADKFTKNLDFGFAQAGLWGVSGEQGRDPADAWPEVCWKEDVQSAARAR